MSSRAPWERRQLRSDDVANDQDSHRGRRCSLHRSHRDCPLLVLDDDFDDRGRITPQTTTVLADDTSGLSPCEIELAPMIVDWSNGILNNDDRPLTQTRLKFGVTDPRYTIVQQLGVLYVQEANIYGEAAAKATIREQLAERCGTLVTPATTTTLPEPELPPIVPQKPTRFDSTATKRPLWRCSTPGSQVVAAPWVRLPTARCPTCSPTGTARRSSPAVFPKTHHWDQAHPRIRS